jgi:hypothetical protein
MENSMKDWALEFYRLYKDKRSTYVEEYRFLKEKYGRRATYLERRDFSHHVFTLYLGKGNFELGLKIAQEKLGKLMESGVL